LNPWGYFRASISQVPVFSHASLPWYGPPSLGYQVVPPAPAPVAFDTVQNELAPIGSLKAHIQSLDELQDRRVLAAGVPEVHRPFDSREVGVLAGDAADLQGSLRIGPCQGVLRARCVELLALVVPRPIRQQLL
jgi:hypothetical protein